MTWKDPDGYRPPIEVRRSVWRFRLGVVVFLFLLVLIIRRIFG